MRDKILFSDFCGLGKIHFVYYFKGLEIFSRPSVPQDYLSFFVNLTCFYFIVRLSMSKLYWETSEMDSVVRTLGTRDSSPISICLA